MYCLIDLQSRMLFLWNGKETEPQLSHGIFVNANVSMTETSFIYAAPGSLDSLGFISRKVPASQCLRIPDNLCDLIAFCKRSKINARLIALQKLLHFDRLLRLAATAFCLAVLLCSQSGRMSSASKGFEIGQEEIPLPPVKTPSGLKGMLRSAHHFAALENISPRATMLQEFSLDSSKAELPYRIFPLHDHFSRTLQISAELGAPVIYVYTTNGQWEFLSPTRECEGKKHYTFSAQDKFLVVLETDLQNLATETLSIATFPINFGGAFLCHAELKQSQ